MNIIKNTICLLILGILFSCELQESDPEEENETVYEYQSAIVAKPTFVSGSERVSLLSPFLSQSVDITGTVTFYFDRSISGQYELYIFDTEPVLGNLRKGDYSGCVAGISQLINQNWVASSAVLSDSSDNQFYACDPGASYPISITDRFTLSDLESGKDYYWFIVVYDRDFLITASSEARSFQTN